MGRGGGGGAQTEGELLTDWHSGKQEQRPSQMGFREDIGEQLRGKEERNEGRRNRQKPRSG